MCISGKITTLPRLFSEHSLQKEIKHQIMNVHTKWNCLIPICLVGQVLAVSGMREVYYLCSHHVCTRAQSIAHHFNFRTSDKASFQVGVTSEAVFFDPISS